ncbi:PDGLE domain-containing protein [Nocardioides sp. T2.26MG-1]|uniref:PDGLE domain-containing protein n=1 Tax=Nocardioides sp. T2.26MG-1 TaxID=3041166 RepID=UPI002477C6DD|nr:PDGLE domain-containing protein [Nocardioides sp. T2.26MG-1]CAI9408781.1 hypothetical protein HIDPHFAB_01152 [Nocardioides sp. T2.26MG-1]
MRRVSFRWVALGALVVALLLAGVVSHYASSEPDGLNRVAQDHGFSQTEKDHEADAPLAGYAAKDVDNPRLSGGLAGVVGVVVVLALAGGLAFVVRRRGPAS